MGHGLFCPICGYDLMPSNDICPRCKNYIVPMQTLHEWQYYVEKSKELNISPKQFAIDTEISKNPLYNPNTTEHNAAAEHQRRLEKILNTPAYQPKKDLPKCPTCGSTNIEKISVTKRAIHGAVFGLLSSTARSQMQCKNCGYKW